MEDFDDKSRYGPQRVKRKFKIRQQEIEVKRQEDLKCRAEAIARKELKAVQEKEKLTKEIEKVGLWTSKAEVEDGLEQLVQNMKKIEALKLQINFRNKVLGQTHPNKKLFKFSHNRKQYSMNQLKSNLLTLVEAMHGGDSSDSQTVTAQAQEVANIQPRHTPTPATAHSDIGFDRSTMEEIVKKPRTSCWQED